ncbi:MAG TPA: hypothetical protein VJL29_02640 [Thermoguttaceae bacterium]|nr:hypothetical protein [Thermoguttaceae bacterium]
MAQFVAFKPNVEVNGETVFAVVDGMGLFKSRALQILAQNGIVDPKPGRWYSQQAWLDSFRVISETIGSLTLCAIGRKIPENANFPTDIDSIETALASIDVAYHMNHRLVGKCLFDPRTGKMSEGIGHYRYDKMGNKKVRMTCNNPYPCEFDRGIIEAMAQRFKPAGCLFVSVKHDDDASCRKKGADSCTYHVEW